MWQLLFIQPITKSLLYLTDLTGNLGLAIILLTLVIQLILTPLRLPSLHAAEKMKHLKPHLDSLKDKHKENPQALVQAQMDLYKEHGVNPFGGLLPMLLSLPIIIALYQVLRTIVSSQNGAHFLWLNLASPDPYYVLPLLTAATQWLLTRFTTRPSTPQTNTDDKAKEADMATMVQKNMEFMFPLMLGFITLQLPSGVGIYFVVSAVFAIMQQVFVRKRLKIVKSE